MSYFQRFLGEEKAGGDAMRLTKYAAMSLAAVMVMSTGAYAAETTEAETEEAGSAAESEAESEEETEPEIGGETEYPVTVTNSDGTEVEIKEEPEKVVSLGPNITEIMYSIGAEDKLVARTDYCDYPAEVSELPSIGTLSTPDIEAILALNPDLIVASTHVSEDVMKQFKDAEITVMYLYEEHDIKGVYTMIDTLGIAVNHQDDAKKTVDDMKEKLEKVSEELADIKEEDKPSVYYVVGFGEYGDYTAGGDTFVNGILEAAGAVNAAADVEGWSYSVETLLEQDPDYILLADYNYDSFTTTEPYSNLTAVKEGRVLTIDTNMLDRQCARNADAVVAIAHMLYPDLVELESEEESEEASSDAETEAEETEAESSTAA